MRTSLKILMGLALAALVACGGSDTNPEDLKHLSVMVAPGSVSVPTTGTAQFAASVTNSKKGVTTVKWSVQEANGGTINDSGLYTAPEAPGTFHVVATSDEDPKITATAKVTVNVVGVTVSPDAPTLPTGGAQAFTATVTNTSNTAVTWAVQEDGGGTINSSGWYTAPTTAGTYHVVATSVADPTKSATVAITVQAVGVAVSPSSAELDQGDSVALTGTVSGADNGAILWSVQEANGGQVSSSGVYTAPNAAGTYHVVATSVADASKSQTVEITVHAVAVTVASADSGTLDQGATRAFTATVTGTVHHEVVWSVQETGTGGSVDGLGVYTAPGAAGTYHVVATSAVDATASASAAVDVAAVQIQVSPASATLEAGQAQAFSVTITGTVNTQATFSIQETGGGTVDGSGTYVAPSAIGTYHVVATSAADGTQQAIATVTVPQASSLTYVDPASSGWRLVKNAASTDAHLVLDLVGPSGQTGKGVALTLSTDPNVAAWTQVNAGDAERVANLAFAPGTGDALVKGTAKSGVLTAGVYEKTGAAVDVGGAVASVALDPTAAVLVSGASIPVSVVKAAALDGSGSLAPISVAVGTLKAH